MLIRFGVENFLSFKDMTEFSMMAGKMTRHGDHLVLCNGKRILKGAFVFGANASGKTNLIRAIAFAKDIVVKGLENTNCDKKYFRIDAACKDRPAVFQFDIYAGGHFYSYGFAVSYRAAAIEEEWLYQIGDKEVCIFLRSKQKDGESFVISSDVLSGNRMQDKRFEVYQEDFANPKMNQTLFLTDIAMRSPDEESAYQPFRDVVDWFRRLVIVFSNSRYGGITQLLDNEDKRTQLENLLQYFDTGVQSVSKQEVAFEKAFATLPEPVRDTLATDLIKLLKGDHTSSLVQSGAFVVEVKNVDGELIAHKVGLNHGNAEDLFEFEDESEGTQRLFDLIPLYQQLLNGAVVLVDELDRSLHTKAVQAFIDYFYKLTDGKASQMIVTTHDSNVLDLDLVRQDEIWFVERQGDQRSKLYSLNQFQERYDKNIERQYLFGRYGALPIFRQAALVAAAEEGGRDAE